MRTYELLTILHSEADLFAKGKETVKAELAHAGANIVKEDDMGDRLLAYEVKKQDRGHFYLFTLEMEPEKVAIVSKPLRLKPEVVKFLFVRKEK